LIILSEGEDHDSDVESMAETAAAEGIKIFTIGVGTERGDPIPIKKEGRIQSYLKDDNGEIVITKRDTQTLQKIAEIGNGSYIDGTNTSNAVNDILKELQKIEKQSLKQNNLPTLKVNINGFWLLVYFWFYLISCY